MKTFDYRDSSFEDDLKEINHRTAFPDDINKGVSDILAAIKKDGDTAVSRFAKQFDNADISSDQFRLSEEELTDAESRLSEESKAAIHLAFENVSTFARERLPEDWTFSPRAGVTLGERFVPLDRVAAYIPGGSAPLVSTVLHTITMAKVAGVKEIVVVSPPGSDGSINPAILYAARYAGATEIYRLGGVYAIGALAYGTETIPKVDKIVGPGNAYVTAAKRQVYGHVALDLVAGPSEVLIIADHSADVRHIAADMMAQAEHGSGFEQAVLVTTCDELIKTLPDELERQKALLTRNDIISKVIENGVFMVRAKDIEHACKLASDYATEHLEIMTENAREDAKRITCAGAIFIGPWTPEPVGDFVAGPSHVLPTGGAARYFNGLTVEQFVKRISLLEYDKDALAKEAEALAEFAKLEELDAHGRSVSIRFDS